MFEIRNILHMNTHTHTERQEMGGDSTKYIVRDTWEGFQ